MSECLPADPQTIGTLTDGDIGMQAYLWGKYLRLLKRNLALNTNSLRLPQLAADAKHNLNAYLREKRKRKQARINSDPYLYAEQYRRREAARKRREAREKSK